MLGQAELACPIAGPDTRHQAKIGGIGQCHGLRLVSKGQRAKHRTKHLFLRQSVANRHIAQQKGCLIKAPFWRRIDHLTRAHYHQSRSPGVGQKARHPLLLAAAYQGAQIQVHAGRPDPQLCKLGAKAGQQRLVNCLLNQQTCASRAGLPGVLHNRVEDGRHGGVQVGIGKNDLRALAPEFHGDRAMPQGCGLLNQGANPRAAGKADVIDAPVARQRVAHLMTIAGDDVDDARRKTHFGGQFGHAQQG